MFIVRSARLSHGLPNAARAASCARELEWAGHAVVIHNSSGRQVDLDELRGLVVADGPARPISGDPLVG